MNNKNALPPAKGNPSSAQPMRGLGKRALALLAPKRQCFNTPIEPPGSGLAREAMRKTAI
jgi:hypothetical protein